MPKQGRPSFPLCFHLVKALQATFGVFKCSCAPVRRTSAFTKCL